MNTTGTVFQSQDKRLLAFGKYVSIALSLSTLVTFGLALIAVPISGSNATQNSGFSFPYLNTLSQFPRDFFWQYSALVQLIVFLVFMGVTRQNTKKEKELFSNLASSFATISVAILAFAYYTQLAVVPSSLASGETEGLALLIQYNPHGLFIALEELGYLMMTLAIWSLLPLAGKGNRDYRPIKIVLMVATTLALASFVALSLVYGLNRQDRLEVVIVSIDWLALIVIGFLFFRLYRKEQRTAEPTE